MLNHVLTRFRRLWRDRSAPIETDDEGQLENEAESEWMELLAWAQDPGSSATLEAHRPACAPVARLADDDSQEWIALLARAKASAAATESAVSVPAPAPVSNAYDEDEDWQWLVARAKANAADAAAAGVPASRAHKTTSPRPSAPAVRSRATLGSVSSLAARLEKIAATVKARQVGKRPGRALGRS